MNSWKRLVQRTPLEIIATLHMRWRTWSCVCVVVVLVILFLPLSASAAPPTHAAFAYGPVNRVIAYGTGSDPVSAQAAAESTCRQQGGGADCQGVGWWTYGYASFAKNDSGEWGWGSDQTLEGADPEALSQCGTNCRLTHRLGIGGSKPYSWGNLTPVRGNYTIGGFGPGVGDHTGRDYLAVDFFSDNLAVYAVRPGRVVFSAYNCQTMSGKPPCYGNTVVIDHGGGIYSVYTHLADGGMATLNKQVTAQTQIGTMSNTGCPVDICGSRPHLHFAVRSGSPNLGTNAIFGSNNPVRTPWTKR